MFLCWSPSLRITRSPFWMFSWFVASFVVIVKSVNIHDANETKNVNLSFNYYCRGLGDTHSFVTVIWCRCKLTYLIWHYLILELLATTKMTNRWIHYVNLNTLLRKWSIPVIGVYFTYWWKLSGFKPTKLIGASPGVGWGENSRWKGVIYRRVWPYIIVSNKIRVSRFLHVNNLFCLCWVLVIVARAKTHSAAQYVPRGIVI
jgi:hypothetical protein